MSDSTIPARAHLRVVPDPEHPQPPPGSDPWWPLGWKDFHAGIARPAALTNPVLNAHLTGRGGAFTVDPDTADAAVAAYDAGWNAAAAAADPSTAGQRRIRSAKGATARMTRERQLSGRPARIVLAPTGRTDAAGDELLRVAGPIHGTITAGYRLHTTAHGPIWYLRLGLAAQEPQSRTARPTPLTIGDSDYSGGLVLHRLGEDPDRADRPAPLAALTTTVLHNWHCLARLRAAQAAHARDTTTTPPPG